MSRETAFRIFPIVHQYGMQLMVGCCDKAFQRSQLDLWPSEPIASSEVLSHPGLVQCLALADAKQCDSVVQSCLSKLIEPSSVSSPETIFSALTSPHLNALIDGLRSETNSKVIRRMAGLPGDFKVCPNWRVGCSVRGQIIGFNQPLKSFLSRRLEGFFTHLSCSLITTF
jgi:hypothetical protein